MTRGATGRIVLLVALSVFGVAACDRGPLEDADDSFDDSIDDIQPEVSSRLLI